MASLDLYLPHLLKAEGGFVNHPEDPGGATNKGITLNTYRKYYGQDKTVASLQNITMAQVEHIYRNGYWNKIWGDKIHGQAVAATIFDMAVNAGPRKAVRMAQYVLVDKFKLNISVDGIMGPQTLGALNSVPDDAFFLAYQNLREKYYYYRSNELTKWDLDYPFIQELTTPRSSQTVFLRGWLNRVAAINDVFPFKKKTA